MQPDWYSPGDLVFCHGKGFLAWVIRFMQGLRSPKADAHWNHVAILWEKQENGDWRIIQAEGAGVVEAVLGHAAPGGSFEVVKCPQTCRPDKVIQFALSQVGVKYGFLTIASIVLNVITPKSIALRKPNTWICSALAAGALMYGGWPPSEKWKDLYQVSPADLYGRM